MEGIFLGNWERVIERALKEKPGMTDADMDVFRRKSVYCSGCSEAGFTAERLGDVGITVTPEEAVEFIDDIPM